MAETARKRKTSKPRRTFEIDGDLRRLIRTEARELKMSEEEYLRLVVHLSETLRTSIIPAGLFDGGMLKTLLTNPMMLDMLKGMIGNMVTKWGSNSSDSSSSGGSAAVQAQPAQPQLAPGSQWGGPPAQWGGPGMMQQPGMYAMPGYGMQPPRQMWAGPPPQQQSQPQQQQSSSGGNMFSLDNLSKMVQQFMGSNS